MTFFRNNILLKKSKFLPNKIPNLGFWLESDYGITKDGSNAVSEWVDRSSNGYTLSQATGANQPIFTANEFGPHAGLKFDGSNDSLERSVANPFSSVQNFSCFKVCKATTGTGAENYFMMADLASVNFFGSSKTSAPNNSLRIQSVGAQNNQVTGGIALNNNVGHLITYESNGTAWNARIDGVGDTLTAISGTNAGDAPGDFATLDNITLGVLRYSSVLYLLSNFAAILFYERQLNTAERTRVEDYLIKKYGI